MQAQLVLIVLTVHRSCGVIKLTFSFGVDSWTEPAFSPCPGLIHSTVEVSNDFLISFHLGIRERWANFPTPVYLAPR